MSTTFPTTLDTFTNPSALDTENGSVGGAGVAHHVQHANHNDQIGALQAKVGSDNSSDATSIDYKIRYLQGLLMQLDSRMKAIGATAASSASATVDTLQVYLVSQVFGS